MHFACKAASAAVLCLGLVGQAVPASAGGQEFNPHLHASFPNNHAPKGLEAEILNRLGGHPQNIAEEVAWRPAWKHEAYPVLFGRVDAPHEILVLLDFANPDAVRVWKEVRQAMKHLNPHSAKVVAMADSNELYAYDMMGFAIWTAYRMGQERGCQALDWGLARWNEAKRRTGAKKYINEYDSASSSSELPMVFQGLRLFGTPESIEAKAASYAYEAGNVNMHQAGQARMHYGVKRLPAVVVDGKVLERPDAATILRAAGNA